MYDTLMIFVDFGWFFVSWNGSRSGWPKWKGSMTLMFRLETVAGPAFKPSTVSGVNRLRQSTLVPTRTTGECCRSLNLSAPILKCPSKEIQYGRIWSKSQINIRKLIHHTFVWPGMRIRFFSPSDPDPA